MQNSKPLSRFPMLLGLMVFNIISAMGAIWLYMALDQEWVTDASTAEFLGTILGLNVLVVGVATIASLVLWIQEPAKNAKQAVISILFGLVYLAIAGYFIWLGLQVDA